MNKAVVKKKMLPKWRLRQDGETCLIIEFETQDIVLANHLVCNLAWQLSDEAISGVRDIVPTMVTVALHYHPATIRQVMKLADFVQLITTKVEAFLDRKSTRLNSSHVAISYAVFCLKNIKKKTNKRH